MNMFYIVEAYCKNCGWQGEEEIKKGSSVEVLSQKKCCVCGCCDIVSLGISKGKNKAWEAFNKIYYGKIN